MGLRDEAAFFMKHAIVSSVVTKSFDSGKCKNIKRF